MTDQRQSACFGLIEIQSFQRAGRSLYGNGVFAFQQGNSVTLGLVGSSCLHLRSDRISRCGIQGRNETLTYQAVEKPPHQAVQPAQKQLRPGPTVALPDRQRKVSPLNSTAVFIEEVFVEQTFATWLLPIVGVIVGIVIGYLIARNSAPNSTQRQVDELQERLDTYQSEVVTHFNTTASLLRKLTNSYQDMQDHLSEGADKLALDEQTRQRLLAALHSEENHSHRERLSSPTFTEPPKDYAPKDADVPGTLHENFGLKSKH